MAATQPSTLKNQDNARNWLTPAKCKNIQNCQWQPQTYAFAVVFAKAYADLYSFTAQTTNRSSIAT